MHFSRQLNWWSLRCSWSIACRRCSNYIFILNSIPGFNGLGKDNNKMRQEAFKFWVLVRLILETLRYFYWSNYRNILEMDCLDIEPHRSVWRIWMFRHQMVANPSANNHGNWFVEREECWKTHEFFSLAVGLYQSSSWILPMMGSHDNHENVMTAMAFF